AVPFVPVAVLAAVAVVLAAPRRLAAPVPLVARVRLRAVGDLERDDAALRHARARTDRLGADAALAHRVGVLLLDVARDVEAGAGQRRAGLGLAHAEDVGDGRLGPVQLALVDAREVLDLLALVGRGHEPLPRRGRDRRAPHVVVPRAVDPHVAHRLEALGVPDPDRGRHLRGVPDEPRV